MEINKITENHVVRHHLEGVFSIEPGSTEICTEVLRTEDIVEPDDYDTKDIEIDDQLQVVYDAALTAFADQAGIINTDEDPRNAAAGMMVANAFLGTALDAIKEKAKFKTNKDKLKNTSRQGAPVTNNNLIMTRGELFAMIMNKGDNI